MRKKAQRRIAELAAQGRRFSGFLEREAWWRTEAFRFLKGRSRAISLHDYSGEKELIDAVAHQLIVPDTQKHVYKAKCSKSAHPSPSTGDEWL